MSYLLESGDLQRHIFQTLQPTYARRYRSMMAAIEEYLIPWESHYRRQAGIWWGILYLAHAAETTISKRGGNVSKEGQKPRHSTWKYLRDYWR